MSSNRRSNNKGRIVIRAVQRRQPDISKIARAVIALAMAEAAGETASTKSVTDPEEGARSA